MSSPFLGFCAGLHLAAALRAMQRTWESFSSAQGCPSMVSAWSKNLLLVSEVRETRREEGMGSGTKENNLTMFPISAGNI